MFVVDVWENDIGILLVNIKNAEFVGKMVNISGIILDKPRTKYVWYSTEPG